MRIFPRKILLCALLCIFLSALCLPGLAGAMLMALSFNVTAGVGAGLIARVLLFAAAGRGREISPIEVGLSILFAIYFSVSYL